MKALVTGGAGFIGSNLCQQLIQDDWNVFVVDDLSTGFRDNLVDGVKSKFFTIGVNPEVLKHIVGQVDVIFHLAARPRISYSVEYPFRTCQNNIMSTVVVLEYARNLPQPPRVVYSGSSSIYGETKRLPTFEDDPPNPQSPYALQKWQGEEWCRMYSKTYGLDTVCLRYFNIIGKGSRYGGAYSTVFSAWLYSTLIDISVPPYIEGDGFQCRDFTTVENVVQANILAATSKLKFEGDAFNVAQGETHSLWDCKKVLEEICGKSFELEQRPPRPGDVRNTHADISKAKEILGYNPDTDFKAQVQKMADWYRDFYRDFCEVKI